MGNGIQQEELIGQCRLILGDCLAVVPALGPVDSVVTDPPYGISFRSRQRGFKERRIANDNNPDHLSWACTIAVRHSRYVFMRWDNLYHVQHPRSLITWVKNNWTIGDLKHAHGRQTEVCAFYPGPAHFFPRGRPADVVFCPRTANENHPTEKPVPLMKRVVLWTDGTVLDPFCGSGSTLVACAKLGRAGIGVEIDREHFETACRRVEQAYRQPSLALVHDAPQSTQPTLDLGVRDG